MIIELLCTSSRPFPEECHRLVYWERTSILCGRKGLTPMFERYLRLCNRWIFPARIWDWRSGLASTWAKSYDRDAYDVHSQYCGTRRVFFILQSPKGTSKWLYYCMCHINDTVHPCSRKANVNRWTMMYMQNAQWVSTMLFPANT